MQGTKEGTKEQPEGLEGVPEKEEVEKPDFKGLSFSDVPKEVLEQGASHGGFDASVIESETEMKVDLSDIDNPDTAWSLRTRARLMTRKTRLPG